MGASHKTDECRTRLKLPRDSAWLTQWYLRVDPKQRLDPNLVIRNIVTLTWTTPRNGTRRTRALVFCCQSKQFKAIQSNAMQINAKPYKTMQSNAKQCKAMQSNAKQCKAVQSNATQCKVMQSNAKQCKGVQSNAKQRNAMQSNAKQCKAMQRNAK